MPPPDESRSTTSHRRLRASNLIVLLALPALAAVALATFAALHPWLDLLANFPMHCLLALAVAAPAMAVARRYRWSVLFAAGTLLALGRIVPQAIGAPPVADRGPSAVVRVAFANLNADNRRIGDVIQWVVRTDPAVVALAEVTPHHWFELAPLRERYPYSAEQPRLGCFGIALLSRYPLRHASIKPLGPDGLPAITAVVEMPDGLLGVVVAHPPPPVFGGDRANRDGGLRALPALLADLPKQRIVLADLNATPWTAPFRQLLDAAGLADSSLGQGYPGSWPVGLPRWLRIPIDHVLVSQGIGVRHRALGPDIGSDHLPVLADLVVPFAAHAEQR